MTPKATLIHNGKTLACWTKCSVTKSLRSISGQFVIEVVIPEEGLTIVAGDPCEVKLEGNTVIKGFVDDIADSTTDTTCNVIIKGRDKTGDLVDCSVPFGTKPFLNGNIEDVAKKLCSKYNIDVKNEAGSLPKVENFKPETGESCFAMLERALRFSDVIMTSSSDGELVFAKRGKKKGGKLRVDHCKSIREVVQTQKRFAKVTVVGQTKAGEFDNKKHITIKGEATDSGVPRGRDLVIRIDGKTTQDIVQRRANWEVSSRLSAGYKLSVVVHGWLNSDGVLWEPNTLVECDWRADKQLLLETVCFTLGSDGVLTALELVPKESYEPMPDMQDADVQYRTFRREKRDNGRNFN